jgi:hypothetical protein
MVLLQCHRSSVTRWPFVHIRRCSGSSFHISSLTFFTTYCSVTHSPLPMLVWFYHASHSLRLQSPSTAPPSLPWTGVHVGYNNSELIPGSLTTFFSVGPHRENFIKLVSRRFFSSIKDADHFFLGFEECSKPARQVPRRSTTSHLCFTRHRDHHGSFVDDYKQQGD